MGDDFTLSCVDSDPRPGDIKTVNVALIRSSLDRQGTLSELGAAVVLVCFSRSIEAAERWRKEHEDSFNLPLYVDASPKRDVYRSFGLRSSLSGVWNHEALLYYADEKLAGRELPKADRDAGQDVHQLGGDFVLDSKLTCVVSYPSRHSRDRPIPEQMVWKMKKYWFQSQKNREGRKGSTIQKRPEMESERGSQKHEEKRRKTASDKMEVVEETASTK